MSRRGASGGYTHSSNWIAQLAGGETVFVKAAVDDTTSAWLRAEHSVYSQVTGSFLPAFLGWDEHAAVLILEDLSEATWPPPWPEGAIDAVLHALEEVHSVVPPPGLPAPEEIDHLRAGWHTVADDPLPFLSLGLCTKTWLDTTLPELQAASARAALGGDSLLHLDVRSDNLCLRDERCLLVDWSYAARGNPLLDLTLWLPSLQLEGGPQAHELATDEMADLVAVFAGYLAARAGLPEPPAVPPPGVRPLQLAQLTVALPWATRALGLPPPVGTG